MVKKTSRKSLSDAYRFDNFKTGKLVKGKFSDQNALVLSLSRRSKKVYAINAVSGTEAGTIERPKWFGTCRAAIGGFIWSSTFGAFAVEGPVW